MDARSRTLRPETESTDTYVYTQHTLSHYHGPSFGRAVELKRRQGSRVDMEGTHLACGEVAGDVGGTLRPCRVVRCARLAT